MNNKTVSTFQVGFSKGKRITGNISVIKTTIDRRYLRVQRDRIYWCLVDFEKAFDSVDREALQFKMRLKGRGDNMWKHVQWYQILCEVWSRCDILLNKKEVKVKIAV
jgi:hypothetical protein